MKHQRISLFPLVALTMWLAACNTPVTSPSASTPATAPASATTAEAGASANLPKPDYAAIANKLVVQCAGIKEGEIVSITGEIKDADLLEEIALEVRKVGAFAHVNMYRANPERAKRAMQEIPAKWDTQTNQLGLKMAGLFDASISLSNSEPLNLMEDFPQERLEAQRKANEPVMELRRKRNIRSIQLGGNGLYPSKYNAETLGLTQAELATIFWNGVNTDYTQLQAEGKKYRALLAAAKEVHLTHPNGTDLKVKIEKRPVFVSDGIISAEDIKRGGAARQVWLPAGEVFVTPVPGTAEGRIVVDRETYIGANGNTLIEGLTLDFKAGKLVSMTARAGLEPFKKAYDKITGEAAVGKDEFSVINLGINRSLVLGPKAKRGDYAPAGMVSVGYGGNLGYGGTNKAVGGYETNLTGTTLKLDGKVVVENGVLKP
jgi:leucyl aminopeptidase (aminopeptidase T)